MKKAHNPSFKFPSRFFDWPGLSKRMLSNVLHTRTSSPGLVRAVFTPFLGVLLATLLAGGSADAQSVQWGGSGSTTTTTDFNLNTNWAGGTLPGTGNTALFSGSGQPTANLSAPITIQGLAFSTSGHTISSSGSSLTLTSIVAANTSGDAIHATNISGTNTVSSNIILAPSSGTAMAFDAGGALAGTLVLSGNISQASTTQLSLGVGTFTFSGSNSFTGGVVMVSSASALNIGSANALGTGTLQISTSAGSNNQTVNNSTAGALTLNNGLTFGRTNTVQNTTFGGSDMTFTKAVTLLNANNATTTLTVNNTLTLSGTVGQGSFTNGALTKSGSGTLVLSAANTYTGTTTVSAGALLANTAVSGSNSATGTGSVSVSAGATLGGTGQITPGTGNQITVASGGTIAPGAAGIGTLTLNGNNTASSVLSLTSGAKFAFELNTGLQSDKIALLNGAAGDIAFGGNTIDFSDLSGDSLTAGQYTLFSSNVANAYSGLTLSGSVITGGLTIGTGLSAYSGSTLQVVGNDIVLNVVPEPGTYAMVAGGFGMLLCLQRIRRRNA